MVDNSFYESLAHYVSGMATVSFCMWTAILYRWRKRNRMTFLLFLSVAYISLSFLKDIIFTFPANLFADAKFVENSVSIFDLSLVPLVGGFFIEATRPGFVTNKRLLAAYLPFIALLPLYWLLRSNWVLVGSFVLSMVVSLFVLIMIPINVVRYNKYIADNYSYTNNLGVGWCTGCVSGFFLLIVFYDICFYEATWVSELIYDTFFVIVWNVVCVKSRNHQVVEDMIAFDTTQFKEKSEAQLTDSIVSTHSVNNNEQTAISQLPIGNEPNSTSQSSIDIEQVRYSYIAKSLLRCMENEKLYLNSRLSLADLATAVGSNKTYISTYINGQGMTFYDFINKYRVEEACRIINHRAAGERISMADVASHSGFNSVSSFNRYFLKIKGITPTAYSHRQ